MTAKEYLNQYYEAHRRAECLAAEYEVERIKIDAIKSASDMDGMPHGNGIHKLVEEKAIRLRDKALSWKLAELEAIQIRQEVFELIYTLSAPERDILIERYINLRTWKDVCKEVNYTWPTVRSYHAKALELVQAKIDSDKKIQQSTSGA